MIQFKDLPVEIQQRMLDEQERQGNPRNAEVFEKDIMAGARAGAGFSWVESVEGYAFWEKIIVDGNFAVFYEKYPKTSNEKLYTEEEVRNLFIKCCRNFCPARGEFYIFLLKQCLKWFEKNKK